MIEDVLYTPLDSAVDGLCLRGVERGRRMDELTFYYPIARLEPRRLAALLVFHGHGGAIRGRIEDLTFDPVQGFMTGSMDLVFESTAVTTSRTTSRTGWAATRTRIGPTGCLA